MRTHLNQQAYAMALELITDDLVGKATQAESKRAGDGIKAIAKALERVGFDGFSPAKT